MILFLQVKPVVKLLKQTLVGTGVLLVSSAMLFIFATPVEDFFKSTFALKESPSAVVPASKMNSKFNIKYTQGVISINSSFSSHLTLSSLEVLTQSKLFIAARRNY